MGCAARWAVQGGLCKIYVQDGGFVRYPPTRVGVTWKYLICRIQTMQGNPNPKPKLQNPESKLQKAPFGAATKRTKTKLIQNPNSKIQNPRSQILNPNSKIPNLKSKLQNPKSKIQTALLEFGFWIWSGRDRRRWLCSNHRRMRETNNRLKLFRVYDRVCLLFVCCCL